MKTKECKDCKVEMPIEEFLPLLRGKYYKSYCKSCMYKRQRTYESKNKKKIKAIRKKWMDAQKNGFYNVYLIVNENYVGSTDNIYRRMANHKNLGRDISKIEIIAKFKNRKDAIELEKFLHNSGYEGKHINNKYR